MKWTLMVILAVALISACTTQTEPSQTAGSPPSVDEFLGRWDVTVKGQDADYPSWFEITRNAEGDLEGRFVGRVGSARSITTLSIEGDTLAFSLPVQYESHPEDMAFQGTLANGVLSGTTNAEDGSILQWSAFPAPSLERAGTPEWGEPIDLLAGGIDEHWELRHPGESKWVLRDGILENTAQGIDLVSKREFQDFRLQLEFKCPEGSNSGIYLRGRYEVQVQDGYGAAPNRTSIGSVYGFLTPSENASRPAGEWQTYEITLVGRSVTVVLNGTTVLDQQEIPGITGGALDSNEEEPGPIMIQGDHGPISYRNISIIPAR